MTIKGNQSEIAVAEVVGFIIILGIMMTGIALVTLYGYPALVKEQANANIKNMQRNMIVLQNDMESLTYKSVPYEETTLQVSDGTLSVINPNPISDPGHSRFTIEQNGTPIDFDPTIPGSIYFYPGLIQFVSSPPNAIIGLQNGAVVMNYFGQVGSTMLSEHDGSSTLINPGKKHLFYHLSKYIHLIHYLQVAQEPCR